jgi:hypothetical protein
MDSRREARGSSSRIGRSSCLSTRESPSSLSPPRCLRCTACLCSLYRVCSSIAIAILTVLPACGCSCNSHHRAAGDVTCPALKVSIRKGSMSHFFCFDKQEACETRVLRSRSLLSDSHLFTAARRFVSPKKGGLEIDPKSSRDGAVSGTNAETAN